MKVSRPCTEKGHLRHSEECDRGGDTLWSSQIIKGTLKRKLAAWRQPNLEPASLGHGARAGYQEAGAFRALSTNTFNAHRSGCTNTSTYKEEEPYGARESGKVNHTVSAQALSPGA